MLRPSEPPQPLVQVLPPLEAQRQLHPLAPLPPRHERRELLRRVVAQQPPVVANLRELPAQLRVHGHAPRLRDRPVRSPAEQVDDAVRHERREGDRLERVSAQALGGREGRRRRRPRSPRVSAGAVRGARLLIGLRGGLGRLLRRLLHLPVVVARGRRSSLRRLLVLLLPAVAAISGAKVDSLFEVNCVRAQDSGGHDHDRRKPVSHRAKGGNECNRRCV